MSRSLWVGFAGAVLCVNSLAPSSLVEAKVGKSLVVGGIRPCSGLLRRNLPRYTGGTVFVLKGRITWTKRGVQSFPKRMIAQQTVAVNGTYRFALAPGRYVLVAHLPHSNVRPFVQVAVHKSLTSHADIPNMCI